MVDINKDDMYNLNCQADSTIGSKGVHVARRSTAEKAETHERIIERASRAFREHGSGVGIGQVMQELGLTHGGFYRHFESKDDLLVEAIARSLDEIAERLDTIGQAAAPGKELEAIITAYLSAEHLWHPDTWCALATLAADIGRQPAAVRKRLDAALARYMERMAKYMPGAGENERRQNFVILFSGMSGAMAMTRACGDKVMRERVLQTTRDYYLSAFAGAPAATGVAEGRSY
jgi:TetR/AcrR family transcriptional repressor of nem operon